ncbi:hypothetical protein FNF27_05843 [Cafeteria roenbergensis]|uniref:IPT/TIG domain-containing protein n=1 Tax=Cafeteria roenbergensis TaxID=33653 RepID=A0A5A8E5L3_CAFRO|nr:hypothetical protein FNF27_05843 [Cafeteria roenbergensis]KAA0172618.1 hypothetical protein FNF27_05843 [Cafeteria roenbergensis]
MEAGPAVRIPPATSASGYAGFGSCFALMGDLDGNGFGDLMVGHRGAGSFVGSGAVDILYLAKGGAVKSRVTHSKTAGAFQYRTRDLDLLGDACVCSLDTDLDGDSSTIECFVSATGDWTGGVAYERYAQGAVWSVRFTKSSGASAISPVAFNNAYLPIRNLGFVNNFEFGSALAILGGSASALRLAVGMQGHSIDSNGDRDGKVHILTISSSGRAVSGVGPALSRESSNMPSAIKTALSSSRDLYIGAALVSAGDIDGDGSPDLFVGAFGVTGIRTKQGAILLFLLTPSGDLKSADLLRFHEDVPTISSVYTGAADVGKSLAGTGDLLGTGGQVFLTGLPIAYSSTTTESGGVLTFAVDGAQRFPNFTAVQLSTGDDSASFSAAAREHDQLGMVVGVARGTLDGGIAPIPAGGVSIPYSNGTDWDSIVVLLGGEVQRNAVVLAELRVQRPSLALPHAAGSGVPLDGADDGPATLQTALCCFAPLPAESQLQLPTALRITARIDGRGVPIDTSVPPNVSLVVPEPVVAASIPPEFGQATAYPGLSKSQPALVSPSQGLVSTPGAEVLCADAAWDKLTGLELPPEQSRSRNLDAAPWSFNVTGTGFGQEQAGQRVVVDGVQCRLTTFLGPGRLRCSLPPSRLDARSRGFVTVRVEAGGQVSIGGLPLRLAPPGIGCAIIPAPAAQGEAASLDPARPTNITIVGRNFGNDTSLRVSGLLVGGAPSSPLVFIPEVGAIKTAWVECREPRRQSDTVVTCMLPPVPGAFVRVVVHAIVEDGSGDGGASNEVPTIPDEGDDSSGFAPVGPLCSAPPSGFVAVHASSGASGVVLPFRNSTILSVRRVASAVDGIREQVVVRSGAEEGPVVELLAGAAAVAEAAAEEASPLSPTAGVLFDVLPSAGGGTLLLAGQGFGNMSLLTSTRVMAAGGDGSLLASSWRLFLVPSPRFVLTPPPAAATPEASDLGAAWALGGPRAPAGTSLALHPACPNANPLPPSEPASPVLPRIEAAAGSTLVLDDTHILVLNSPAGVGWGYVATVEIATGIAAAASAVSGTVPPTARTTVLITGEGFGPPAAASASDLRVWIGCAPCSDASVIDDTRVTCVAELSAGVDLPVTAELGGRIDSGSALVSAHPANASDSRGVASYAEPAVASVVPPYVLGSESITAGPLEVSGVNLGSRADLVREVTVDNVACAGVVWQGPTRLVCGSINTSLLVDGVVVVSVANARSSALARVLDVDAYPRVNVVVSGQEAPASPGLAGTRVVFDVNGMGRDAEVDLASVRVGAYPCARPELSSSGSRLSCTLSGGIGAGLRVHVRTAAGRETAPNGLFSFEPPVVTTAAPMRLLRGAWAGTGPAPADVQDFNVTIRGRALAGHRVAGAGVPAAPTVAIGGIPCAVTSAESFPGAEDLIECSLPPGAWTGDYITVTAAGRSASLRAEFAPAPRVVALAMPSSRPTAQGWELGITVEGVGWHNTSGLASGGGSGVAWDPAPPDVFVGGVPCASLSVPQGSSSTGEAVRELLCQVAPGAGSGLAVELETSTGLRAAAASTVSFDEVVIVDVQPRAVPPGQTNAQTFTLTLSPFPAMPVGTADASSTAGSSIRRNVSLVSVGGVDCPVQSVELTGAAEGGGSAVLVRCRAVVSEASRSVVEVALTGPVSRAGDLRTVVISDPSGFRPSSRPRIVSAEPSDGLAVTGGDVVNVTLASVGAAADVVSALMIGGRAAHIVSSETGEDASTGEALLRLRVRTPVGSGREVVVSAHLVTGLVLGDESSGLGVVVAYDAPQLSSVTWAEPGRALLAGSNLTSVVVRGRSLPPPAVVAALSEVPGSEGLSLQVTDGLGWSAECERGLLEGESDEELRCALLSLVWPLADLGEASTSGVRFVLSVGGFTAASPSLLAIRRPSVVFLLPASGPQSGGFEATVKGSGLGSHPSQVQAVTLAGRPAKVISAAETPAIVAHVGGRACDSVRWVSANEAECAIDVVSDAQFPQRDASLSLASAAFRLEDAFDAMAAPCVEMVTPQTARSGQILLVVGTGFGRVAADVADVRVGSVACSAWSMQSPTALSCVVPPEASHPDGGTFGLPVTVTLASGSRSGAQSAEPGGSCVDVLPGPGGGVSSPPGVAPEALFTYAGRGRSPAVACWGVAGNRQPGFASSVLASWRCVPSGLQAALPEEELTSMDLQLEDVGGGNGTTQTMPPAAIKASRTAADATLADVEAATVVIVSKLDVEWPASLLSLFDVFDASSSVSADTLSVDCLLQSPLEAQSIGDRPFVIKAALSLLVPAAVIGTLLLVAAIAFRTWSLIAAMLLTFVVQSSSTRTALRLLTCVGIGDIDWEVQNVATECEYGGPPTLPGVRCGDGRGAILQAAQANGAIRRHLAADLGIDCTDREAQPYIYGLGLTSFLAYGLGVPLAGVLLLIAYRKRLDDASIQARLGFLYLSFRPHGYLWENLVILRKTLLAVSTVFLAPLGPSIQATASSLVLGGFIAAQAAARPYKAKLLNQAELASLLACHATMLGGLMLAAVSPAESPGFFGGVAAAVVAVNVACLAMFARAFLWALHKDGIVSSADMAAPAMDTNDLGKALWEAAKEGNTAEARRLLDERAPVDWQNDDADGTTALMAAARHGHNDTVELLLDRGADLGATGSYGTTALTAAAAGGSKATVELLLDRGADLAAKDSMGYTVLMAAAARGHKDTVELLLDRGADLAAKDSDGKTALMRAASSGNKDMVKLLLDRGADLAAKDRGCRTVLMAAVDGGRADTVELLLDCGADLNSRDMSGNDAFNFCINDSCARVLRSAERIQRWHRRRLLVMWER